VLINLVPLEGVYADGEAGGGGAGAGEAGDGGAAGRPASHV
jgi:hypothetical protein